MSSDSAGCLGSTGTGSKPTVSILGLAIIRDPANHFARRIVWLASLIACLMLAVVHGAGLIHRYRNYPTRVQLDVANRQGTPLPAVTVCPHDRFDLKRLERLWRTSVANKSSNDARPPTPPDPAEQYYQLADVVSVEEIWRHAAYANATELFPMCYIGRGTDCHGAGSFQTIWTPSGTCFTYSSEHSTLSGHFNGLYMRLSISHKLDEFRVWSGWKVVIHETGVSPWLTSSRQYIEMSTRYKLLMTNGSDQNDQVQGQQSDNGGGMIKTQFMYTRLRPKEFIRANHPRQPCQPDNDAWSKADCEIDCFQRLVTSVTNCRLPYMTTVDRTVPYCNTSASVRQTEELIARLITEPRSQLKCNCVEACTKVVYKYEIESHTVDVEYGRIKVFYDTSLWVTVREVFVYSWVKLLCDAGNILCLLLGASVLSFFEIAELIITMVSRCFLPNRQPF